MKIVFVVADNALAIVSVAIGSVFAFARGPAGRRPKSEAEHETDDENTCSFKQVHRHRPQIRKRAQFLHKSLSLSKTLFSAHYLLWLWHLGQENCSQRL